MNATEDLGWLDSPLKLDASVERLKLAQSVGLSVGMDFHGRGTLFPYKHLVFILIQSLLTPM